MFQGKGTLFSLSEEEVGGSAGERGKLTSLPPLTTSSSSSSGGSIQSAQQDESFLQSLFSSPRLNGPYTSYPSNIHTTQPPSSGSSSASTSPPSSLPSSPYLSVQEDNTSAVDAVTERDNSSLSRNNNIALQFKDINLDDVVDLAIPPLIESGDVVTPRTFLALQLERELSSILTSDADGGQQDMEHRRPEPDNPQNLPSLSDEEALSDDLQSQHIAPLSQLPSAIPPQYHHNVRHMSHDFREPFNHSQQQQPPQQRRDPRMPQHQQDFSQDPYHDQNPGYHSTSPPTPEDFRLNIRVPQIGMKNLNIMLYFKIYRCNPLQMKVSFTCSSILAEK